MISCRLFRPSLVPGLLLLALNASAVPMQFEFSYTFAGASAGAALTGTFSGEQSGDLITDISDFTLTFDNQTYSDFSVDGWNSFGAPVISTDLFKTDLWVNHATDFLPYFGLYFLGDGSGFGALYEDFLGNHLSDGPDQYGVWIVRAASVPEADPTFFLLSAALGGVVLLKRRFSGLLA